MKWLLLAAAVAVAAVGCGSKPSPYDHYTVKNSKGQIVDCYGNYKAVSCDWDHPRDS